MGSAAVRLHASADFSFSAGDAQAWFSSEKLVKNGTVALSFLFDKRYLIIEYLDLKDLSRGLQMNCANSFCFHVYLILHACAERFDVTGNLENFWQLGHSCSGRRPRGRRARPQYHFLSQVLD